MAKRRRPHIKDYYKPTPVRLRKIGDAMLGASTFVATTYSFMFEGPTKWAVLICAVGAVGKFLTNLFTDEDNIQQGAHGCDAEPGAQ